MKNTNYILKVMENLQTNVALLSVIGCRIVAMSDKDYNELSQRLNEKELPYPCATLNSYVKLSEEMYNYLEQLLLTIDKPF